MSRGLGRVQRIILDAVEELPEPAGHYLETRGYWPSRGVDALSNLDLACRVLGIEGYYNGETHDLTAAQRNAASRAMKGLARLGKIELGRVDVLRAPRKRSPDDVYDHAWRHARWYPALCAMKATGRLSARRVRSIGFSRTVNTRGAQSMWELASALDTAPSPEAEAELLLAAATDADVEAAAELAEWQWDHGCWRAEYLQADAELLRNIAAGVNEGSA